MQDFTPHRRRLVHGHRLQDRRIAQRLGLRRQRVLRGAWLRRKSDAAEFVLVWRNRLHGPSFLPVFRAIDAWSRQALIASRNLTMRHTCKICSPFVPGLMAKRATSPATRRRRTNASATPASRRCAAAQAAACRGGEAEAVGKRPHAEGESFSTATPRAGQRCRRSRRTVNSSPTSSSSSWPAARRRSASASPKGFSWSTVGTDALTVASGRATMNYGWLEPDAELRDTSAWCATNSATRWA